MQREQAIVRDCDAWSVLLLAVTVWSFAHMPLGISDCNSPNIPQTKLVVENNKVKVLWEPQIRTDK